MCLIVARDYDVRRGGGWVGAGGKAHFETDIIHFSRAIFLFVFKTDITKYTF